MNDVLLGGFAQWPNPERNLKDLFQIVVRRRLLSIFPIDHQGPEVLGERMTQPARIDGNHHHKQFERQQKMNCLQDLDDMLIRAAVQIVDVEDDPVETALALLQLSLFILENGLVLLPHQRGQLSKILLNQSRYTQVFPIITRTPITEQSDRQRRLHPSRRQEVGKSIHFPTNAHHIVRQTGLFTVIGFVVGDIDGSRIIGEALSEKFTVGDLAISLLKKLLSGPRQCREIVPATHSAQ